MDLDVDEMFGLQIPPESRRGSIASGSGGDSASEAEEDDDGGRNNPMEEAMEVPDPEAPERGQQSDAAKVVKPKRVIKNPMPKLDAVRIAGPRGIPIIQKSFKNVKFHGKGHEKEDLDILLKHLEHWAHRMYPKLPFKNIVEQLEKLGAKKPVQVMMKRIRLDMYTESELEGKGEDDVKRGEDEEDKDEPVVDVFDELLGQSGFPTFPASSQPVTTLPIQSKPGGLTDEQRERLERNKRLAAEKRLARLKAQQERERLWDEMDTSGYDPDHAEPPSNHINNLGGRQDPVENPTMRITTVDEALNDVDTLTERIGDIPGREMHQKPFLEDTASGNRPEGKSGEDSALNDPSTSQNSTKDDRDNVDNLLSLPMENERDCLDNLSSISKENERDSVGNLSSLPKENERDSVDNLSSLPKENERNDVDNLLSLPKESERDCLDNLSSISKENEGDSVDNLSSISKENEGDSVGNLSLLPKENERDSVDNHSSLPKKNDGDVKEAAPLVCSLNDCEMEKIEEKALEGSSNNCETKKTEGKDLFTEDDVISMLDD